MDRRNFFKLTTASIAAMTALENLHASPLAWIADPQAQEEIRSLPNLAREAKPIERDEYLERQARARRYMKEAKIDAIFVSGGSTMHYFTGMTWGLSERTFGFVLPASGEIAWVTPRFEKERAEELIQFGADVRAWEEDESPYALIAGILKDRGIKTGKLGIEESVRFFQADNIAKAAPAVQPVSCADAVTARCRRVKSKHELALMQLANTITLKAYEVALRNLREGMTQLDLSNIITAAHRQMGVQGGASAQFGAFSAFPHGSSRPQKLQEGDVVMIDGGCKVEGYSSDITRTTVFGKPNDRQRKIWEIEKRAQDAALAAVRPGVACETIDAAARKVITDAGFGPSYRYFTHRVGHGIGLDGHEWPYLVRGNKLKLEPGMTFSDEPGIYIQGEFGVRLEDCFYVAEDGGKLFTPQSPSVDQPFA